MYTGLIGPSPLMAALIIVVLFSRGLATVTVHTKSDKILAAFWGFYILLINYFSKDYNIASIVISSIIQIFLMYYYLHIQHSLEGSIVKYVLFLIIGAIILLFVGTLILVLMN